MRALAQHFTNPPADLLFNIIDMLPVSRFFGVEQRLVGRFHATFQTDLDVDDTAKKLFGAT